MNPLEKVRNFFNSPDAKSAQIASFNLQIGYFDGFFNPNNQTYNAQEEISNDSQLETLSEDNLSEIDPGTPSIETDIQQEL